MDKMIWHLMQCHIIFLKEKMKENKNINKNTHHKSYIKVIIYTRYKGGYNKRKKGGVNK